MFSRKGCASATVVVRWLVTALLLVQPKLAKKDNQIYHPKALQI